MKLPIYPTTEEFNSVCPEKLKKMFHRCIAIYDCTEFYTQMPSKLDLQIVCTMFFLNYNIQLYLK